MAPQSVPEGSCLSCNDSPLSITGNIIGILTFIYAVGLGLRYYTNLVRNAMDDIYVLIDTLQRSWGEIQELEKITSDIERNNTNLPESSELIRQSKKLLSGHYRDLLTVQARTQKIFEGLSDTLRNRKSIPSWLSEINGDIAILINSLTIGWTSRVRYLSIRKELQEISTRRDQLMSEARNLIDRYSSNPACPSVCVPR